MSELQPESIAATISQGPATYAYFFSKADASWLRFLNSEKFFTKPPPPKRGPDWIQYPNWPESQYLARVASQSPDEVFEIARAIPDTANVRVHENIVEIALQLGGDQADQLAVRVISALSTLGESMMSLPPAIAELVSHLANEGQVDTAFALASALLQVIETESDARAHRAVGLIDDHQYGEAITLCWPALVAANPIAAFELLCEKLDETVSAGYISGESQYDSTSTWRPSIADHAQNLGGSLLDTLVEAARDWGKEIARYEQIGIEPVVSVLANFDKSIFARLSLFLIEACGSDERVAEILGGSSFGIDANNWHEYSSLLETRLPTMPSELAEAVLNEIESDEVHALVIANYRGEIKPEEKERLYRLWLLDRLTLVKDSLRGDRAARWRTLVEEFGEPAHPDFLSYHSSWSGESTPYDAEELQSLPVEDMVALVSEWRAEDDGGFRTPSVEGLAAVLGRVVSEDGLKHSAAADAFIGMDAAYSNAVLSGLMAALDSGSEIDWPATLRFCQWVVGDEQTHQDDAGGAARQHRQSSAQAAAWLINSALNGRSNGPSLEERAQVWQLIDSLAADLNPTPDHEAKYGGTNMDPTQLSLNTIRGQAIHAVMKYSLWVERELAGSDGFNGLETIPEVDELLRAHLDVSRDPSLAVRAVFGEWFPQLVRLDETWATELMSQVFPLDSDAEKYFDAAWNAYLAMNRGYDSVLKVLMPIYEIATKRIGATSSEGGASEVSDARLGQHLVTFCVRGKLGHEDGGILAVYWSKASAELKKTVIGDLGTGLGSSPELNEEIRSASHELWEWLNQETPHEQRDSLGAFGEWFRSDAVGAAWLLTKAIELISERIALVHPYLIFERLEEFAPSHVEQTAELLRLLVTQSSDPWNILGSERRIHKILETIMAQGDEESKEKGLEAMHLLGAQGLTEFRELARVDES